MIAPVPPTPEQNLINVATAVCRKANYPVDDLEYQSAINYAVAITLKKYKDKLDNTASLNTIASNIALRVCKKTLDKLERLKRGDQAGARRGIYDPPSAVPPIPLADYELLAFVAHHGRERAARLLGMRRSKLIRLLEDVELRLAR